jgi:hypothetical protein
MKRLGFAYLESLSVSLSQSLSAFSQEATADSDTDSDTDSERLGFFAVLEAGKGEPSMANRVVLCAHAI